MKNTPLLCCSIQWSSNVVSCENNCMLQISGKWVHWFNWYRLFGCLQWKRSWNIPCWRPKSETRFAQGKLLYVINTIWPWFCYLSEYEYKLVFWNQLLLFLLFFMQKWSCRCLQCGPWIIKGWDDKRRIRDRDADGLNDFGTHSDLSVHGTRHSRLCINTPLFKF